MNEHVDGQALRTAVPSTCVRVVRVGHGGNCSSVGSVIDTLFLGAAAGGAIFAAICAAMQAEKIRVVPSAHEGGAASADEEPDAR